ncbi:acetyl-CoA C-acyltransferase [Rhodobacteraceae bacterium CCMM004]|nr:acetyl-CoA C-acyltransferase [Rhodobacteraceae bacterium CCMM004]
MDVEREAWICGYVRTPIGRYGGALAAVRPDDLAAHALTSVLDRVPQVDPAAVDEVILGCANQAGEDNRNVARMAALLASLPVDVPAVTLNRLCGSGLDAVAWAARAIRCGEADLVLAGGVESMTRAPLVQAKAEAAFSRRAEIHDTTIGWRFVNPALAAAHGTHSMPETAEAVADAHGIPRADQDAYAARSQARAADATAWRAGEIAPLEIPRGRGAVETLAADEHPRPGTTVTDLARLRPVVRADGTVTAGNASGVNDGAAALVVASGRAMRTHGLTPMARVVGTATAGVAPRIMGIGPVPATERLCARLDRRMVDFDAIELNEAFAAQVLAVTRAWGLPDDDPRVNRNGGAIALGHPLGASGARLAGTLARLLAEGRAQRGLATLCVGVGQGVAMALDAPS